VNRRIEPLRKCPEPLTYALNRLQNGRTAQTLWKSQDQISNIFLEIISWDLSGSRGSRGSSGSSGSVE
jgi:hypothetical protein